MKWSLLFNVWIGLIGYTHCSLIDLRRSVDILDEQLYDLLVQRMHICRRIGRMKSRGKIHVASREDEIVERLQEKNELNPRFVKVLWSQIFQESCHLQQRDQLLDRQQLHLICFLAQES